MGRGQNTSSVRTCQISDGRGSSTAEDEPEEVEKLVAQRAKVEAKQAQAVGSFNAKNSRLVTCFVW